MGAKKLNMAYFLGIDPGATGGAVLLDSLARPIYVMRFSKYPTRNDWLTEFSTVALYNQSLFCHMEHVHAMPKDGVKQSFSFGGHVERLKTMLNWHGIGYELVTPRAWMNSFKMFRKKSETKTKWKNRLRAKAKELYPQENITLDVADAYLIARYCWKQSH